MNTGLLLDTGPLVAWLDADDQWHQVAVDLARDLHPPFFTCESVLTETCFLLQRLPRAIDQLSRWVSDGHIQVALHLSTESMEVFRLMKKYHELPMSLADACLVRMIETGVGHKVFTFDSHFRIYRYSGRSKVPLLMPDRTR